MQIISQKQVSQSVGPGAQMFGLENMVALIIGNGKVDLRRKGREPLKRVTDCVGHSTEVRDCLGRGARIWWGKGNQNEKRNPGDH